MTFKGGFQTEDGSYRNAYVDMNVWHTMINRIRNQEFMEKLRVAPLTGKICENRLR